MLQVHKHKIDLDNLDFNRSYTLEEFEYINEQLKTCTLIVDREPVNLFELDEKGHLIAIPQTPYYREKFVFEISGQFRNWILSSRNEDGDIGNDINNSKFVYLDEKIKNEYFVEGTSVQLCWLIDPQNKRIYTYKRGRRRQEHGWKDINRENILSNFTLDIEMVNDVLSQTFSETSENENDLEINCPECDETFTERLFFMKHYEKQHARKKQ
ncbi:5619_t:CDS:2, partial [Racocetra persica]